jgi:hypothetical protein
VDATEDDETSTAPIPALAPVIRTVLPSNLDALKIDIDEQGGKRDDCVYSSINDDDNDNRLSSS